MNLLELGINPIIGSSPAGQDVRSSDIYEKLVQEIDKRNSLSASASIDWNNVVALSQEILSDYAKDILVCSYLSVGLLNLHGLKGLADGVTIYKDLIANFWSNGLFPPRPNGRLNALHWWLENVSAKVQSIEVEMFSPEDKLNFEQSFDQLISTLEENGVEEVGELLVLKNLCSQRISTASNSGLSAEASSSANSASESPSSNVHKTITPTTSLEHNHVNNSSGATFIDFNGENVDKSLESISLALTKVSSILANTQQLSYKIFKINRFVAWLDIDILPVSDEEKKTLLPPPDEYLQNSILGLYQNNNWIELIKLVEPRVTDYRFWLDLSFYSYTALKSMNQLVAANEIISAVSSFIKRLPNLDKLLFSDGTPFASAETQEWLSNIGSSNQGTTNIVSYANSVSSNGQSDDIASEFQQARELLEQGRLEQAISLLHEVIISSRNYKYRLLRIINFCQFCIVSGNIHLTKGYINELLAMIADYKLESWDQELVTNIYKLILNLGKNKKILNIDENILSDILMRLSLIDPVSAIMFYK